MPISMNLSSERKHSMKSFLMVISLALAFVSPAFAGIEWGFDSSANPASAFGGAGSATITVGSSGAGWLAGGGVPWNLGSATGFWDLGHAGSIVLSGMNVNGPVVTLQVFQWVQPGTYSGLLGYSLNGNAPVSITSLITESTSHGAWWEYDVTFAQGLIPADHITITAPGTGAIIDRLTLVPEPATLIAGAILLIPFALSTWPILRRRGK